MEPDRTHKCGECDAKFSSADLLSAHLRRHEMTLNLSTKSLFSIVGSSSLTTPSISKSSHSAGIIGCFVDETPTPTRFIRNCEEVGLFQDLQNVNPFDEDFKKAASSSAVATPSGEGFEFTFSSSVIGPPGTPINLQETALCLKTPNKSKRRYSDQDTLNTPQVFPCFNYASSTGTLQPTSSSTNTTSSISACLTPTNNISQSVDNLKNILPVPQAEAPVVVSTTSYNHEEHVSIIAYTSAISHQTNPNNKNCNNNDTGGIKKTESPKTASELVKRMAAAHSPITSPTNKPSQRKSSLKIRSKSQLKLDLKHVSSRFKISSNMGGKCTSSSSNNISKGLEYDPDLDVSEKRELLERNKAAAHRSRERRKQWIYGLESRCRALETLLIESQAEVSRLKAENEVLRNQLGKSGEASKEVQSQGQVNVIFSLESRKDTPNSIIIHQVPDSKTHTAALQEPLTADTRDASGAGENMVAAIVSPIVLPTVKAKRGRPRKGEERRVPIQSISIMGPSVCTKTLPKIPILPIAKLKKKS